MNNRQIDSYQAETRESLSRYESLPPAPRHSEPPPPAPEPRSRGTQLLAIAALVLPLALGAGFIPRWRAQRALAAETRALAVPTVTVVSPVSRPAVAGAPLPAELSAFTEAPIYARANGYLRRWLVDIGDRVEAGQLLAEIDTPELDQELARTRAEVAQAEAAVELARTTAARWTALVNSASVSTQETAEKKADYELKSAVLDGARANLRRLEDLQGFTKIVAPFSGTITARRTDVGQLIAASSGQELFRLAQTGTLRVFVHVPQGLTHAIEPGQMADVTVPDLPGRTFRAKVVRTAGAMEADSRTMVTELEVDNSKGELLAGSYAQARFIQAQTSGALILPSNTLLFRAEGMQVGVVGPGGQVELRSVKLGRDFGQTVEVLEGVGALDQVILNPSDSLAAGTLVRLATPPGMLTAR